MEIPLVQAGFADFIDGWSQCDFCLKNFGDIRNIGSQVTITLAVLHSVFSTRKPFQCISMCIHMNNSSILVVKIRFTTFAVDIDCICFEKGKEKTLQLKISGVILKILEF